jgi:death-on-curing protein
VNEPVWVLEEVVLALHDTLLAEFGGLGGVRDLGLLRSAMGRPKNLYAYEKPTVFDLAAAYAFGIVRNHPFNDGNKRTGFVAAVLFLEANGYNFAATEIDATITTLAFAAKEIGEPEYAAWLKRNSQKG